MPPSPSQRRHNHYLMSQMLKPKDKPRHMNELGEESIYLEIAMKITSCPIHRLWTFPYFT